MKKNMSFMDRIIRIIISAVFAILYFTGTVTGTWGMLLVVLAVIFTLTSLVSFCPLYAIFGISTCKTKS
jgi:hypothetical protein